LIRGDPHTEASDRQALLTLLSTAYGSETLAQETLDAALLAAELAVLPAHPLELLFFVRAYIEPLVAADLGELIAAALSSELASYLGPLERQASRG
jgi:hypothetical protein